MKGCDDMEPLTNYKVTEQEIKENGVQAVQGEVLYGEPSENKLIFDRLVTFLIGKYNRAVEWLVDKAHIHTNKALLDTITSETNVHEHANKGLLDTIQEVNVHLHENKTLLDLIDSREQIHEHANQAFLDSLKGSDIHSHENKSTLDTITQNMIAKWNQSAGIEDGNTDMDYGSFTGTHSVLQIRRGSASELPVLSEGELGLAGSILHIGTPEGNRALADKEAVEEAIGNINLEPYAKTTEVAAAIEAGQDLLFTNVSVPASTWTATSNYTYTKYQAVVNLAGVTSTMDAEVFYAPNDADSGIFSGAGMVNDGSITLLAIKQPTTNITIPKIRLMRGASI